MIPVLIIPAYNPDVKLLELLNTHKALSPSQDVIIINDGSCEACMPLFQQIEEQGYRVLHHEKNQGKGAALKTGMQYFLDHYDQSPGVVTADADGQHTANDILRLSESFLQEPNQLHLGVRQIDKKNIPLRSRFGNVLTKFLFNYITKNRILDTQSGLRVIPTALVRQLMNTSTARYDFEFEMFFIARKYLFKIRQMPIETIYIDHNKSSHFNPLLDSLRIYFIFIRFCSVAFCSFFLDFTLFTLIYHLTGQSALAVFLARSISAPFNFISNKKISFKSKDNFLLAATLYFFWMFCIAFLSFYLMSFINDLGINIYSSKIIAEFVIFLANFLIQYFVIFSRRPKETLVEPGA